MLLGHQAALDRWLQPGGHHEGLDRLEASARRKVAEETGLSQLDRLADARDGVFDIDTHAIPANPAKGEGAHSHHDFLYLFASRSDVRLAPQSSEVRGVRWWPREALSSLGSPRLQRVAGKLQALRDRLAKSGR